MFHFQVHDVYKRCELARDQQQPDTLQMLGAIESRRVASSESVHGVGLKINRVPHNPMVTIFFKVKIDIHGGITMLTIPNEKLICMFFRKHLFSCKG